METSSRSFQIRVIVFVALVTIYTLGALPVATVHFPHIRMDSSDPTLVLWGPYLYLFYGVDDLIFVRYFFICLPLYGLIGWCCFSQKKKRFLTAFLCLLVYYLFAGYAIWAFLEEVVDAQAGLF